MKLRATYRAPDAGRYRVARWGLGRPGSRLRHAAATARRRRCSRRRRPPLRRPATRKHGGRSRRRAAQHGGAPGRRGDVADAQLVGGPRPLPGLLALWCRLAAPLHHQFGAAEVDYMVRAARARGGVLLPDAALGRAGGHHRRPDRGLSLRRAVAANPGTPQSRTHPQPQSPRRSGRGHLHLGIDRAAQGRAPHAPGPGLQGAE